MKPYTYLPLLLCSSMVFANAQKQQQFDDLVKQIVTGEHYFFSADDLTQTLKQLEQLLPANDPQRASMLDRQRCSLGFYHDPAAGIAFSDIKLAQATQRQDFEAIYDYQTCRFYLFDMQGEAEQANTSALLANEAAIKSENPLFIALSETELGNLASYRGDHADALTHYLRAYPVHQQLGYKPFISDLVLSIAAAYRRMGLYHEAISYIDAAENVFNAPEEQFRRAMILHEKAYSYAEMGQAEQALQLFEQSIAIYQTIIEPLWVTYTKVNLVWVYNLLGQFDTALKLAAEAQQELNAVTPDNVRTFETYQALLALYRGEALSATGDAGQALVSLEQAEQRFSKGAVPRYLLLLYRAQAIALAKVEQYQLAYQKSEQYLQLYQQLQDAAKEQQANLLRFQFDVARQQEQNAQLDAEKRAAEQLVNTLQLAQRWQYLALSLIAILLFSLLLLAISLKKRNRRLHRLAMTDELTGIANRRRIMMQAEHERIKMQHSTQPLCILILDLDHFKQINDTYGHDAGDTVLQQVSITMSGLLRQQDYVGRTGGEEFMIVLPDTQPEQAQAIAERIRIAVAKLDLTTIAPALQVSCSIGLTQAQSNELLNSSIARADKALYRAKAEGRNRVVLQ